MTVNYLNDHAERAIARLVLRDKDKADMRTIATAIGVQAQDLEDALFGIYTAQSVTSATGISLDYIGALLSESRNGLSDTEYRAVINAKILASVGSGVREEIIAIADALITSTVISFQVTGGRADFVIKINSGVSDFVTDVQARRLARILNFAKAAGVRAIVMYRNFTTNPFTYNTGPGYGTGKYWGSLDRG